MGRTFRILAIDDSPDDQDLYADALREMDADSSEDFKLVRAETGAEAARMLAQGDHYDCILLDYQLPDTDGLELLEQFKASDTVPPILFLTGYGCERVAAKAIQLGAFDYLPKKDIEGRVLRERVIRAIDEAPSRRPLRQLHLERLERLSEENGKLAKFFNLAPWPMAYLTLHAFRVESANPPMFDLLESLTKQPSDHHDLVSYFGHDMEMHAIRAQESGERVQLTNVKLDFKRELEKPSSGITTYDVVIDAHYNSQNQVVGLLLMIEEHGSFCRLSKTELRKLWH